MGAKSLPQPILPLLFRGAVRRVSQAEISGSYDADQQVWVVDTPAGKRPLASLNRTALDGGTKTGVGQGADDEACVLGLTEIITKTAVAAESDDVGRLNSLLELQTKTEVESEQDDLTQPIL